MPSCQTIATKTVWYAFSPDEDLNLVAEAVGTFKSVLAVYGGSGTGELVEVGCSGGATTSKIEFRGLAGQTYFIQLGSAQRRGGVVDFKLSPSAWQEKVLRQVTQTVDIPEQDVPVLKFHGRPRAANPNMYDITVAVAGQTQLDRGLHTFGLIKEEVKVDLVRIPRQSAIITTTLAYRYDTSQYTCLSDGGDGQPCTANSPIKDLEWLTSGEGSRAELIIRLAVKYNEVIGAERVVTIPFAGQAAGVTP